MEQPQIGLPSSTALFGCTKRHQISLVFLFGCTERPQIGLPSPAALFGCTERPQISSPSSTVGCTERPDGGGVDYVGLQVDDMILLGYQPRLLGHRQERENSILLSSDRNLMHSKPRGCLALAGKLIVVTSSSHTRPLPRQLIYTGW